MPSSATSSKVVDKTVLDQTVLDAFLKPIPDSDDVSAGHYLGDYIRPIQQVAWNADVSHYSWASLRKLIKIQLHNVMTAYLSVSPAPADVDGESFDFRYKRVHEIIKYWNAPPFTCQRLCELLTYAPKKYYTSTKKFMMAVCKVVYGISGRPQVTDDEDFDDAMELDSGGFRGSGMGSAMYGFGDDEYEEDDERMGMTVHPSRYNAASTSLSTENSANSFSYFSNLPTTIIKAVQTGPLSSQTGAPVALLNAEGEDVDMFA